MERRRQQTMPPRRKLSYDLIRVAAIAMVVMVHVSAYMITYPRESGSGAFVTGNIFNALGRAVWLRFSGSSCPFTASILTSRTSTVMWPR